MGELLTEFRKENMQAIKDHDKLRKSVLSLLISAIALAEKESGKTLTKQEELVFVQKELKQTEESLAETPASRQDLIDENNQKIAMLKSYLPTQLSEEEIKTAIETIMQELSLEPIRKSQGPIMKEMMNRYKGQTDGKLVNKVLSTILH